jgi:hypothetical protein
MFKSQRASKSDSISNGCRAGMITTTHTCEPSMQLQRFLFDQLWDQGVRHMFGIPGDFVLNLYEPLEADRRFQLIRLSHDPGVGFAADGAARITNGLAVCCVTYGAGGLNLIKRQRTRSSRASMTRNGRY